jgi:hypothetical protein
MIDPKKGIIADSTWSPVPLRHNTKGAQAPLQIVQDKSGRQYRSLSFPDHVKKVLPDKRYILFG